MTRPIWTDAFLDAKRLRMDETADGVIAAVYEAESISGVSRLLKHFAGYPTELNPTIRAIVDAYLVETAPLPAWADQEKIKRCEDFFYDHGAHSVTILCCASLPECYLDALDAPVLASTHQLEKHIQHRVFTTASMVLDVMLPGGMAPGGAGVLAAQQIRLVHAAVRKLLLLNNTAVRQDGSNGAPAKPFWNVETSGEPINQESMAFVILTFSYVTLRSFEILKNDDLTPEVCDAYIHAWSVIGRVMGVDEDLLAHNFDDAKHLFETIKKRRCGASEAGQALTRALVTWMQELPLMPDSAPLKMLCRLMGDQDAALLGIVDPDRTQHTEDSILADLKNVARHAVHYLETHVPLIGKVSENFSENVLEPISEEISELLLRAVNTALDLPSLPAIRQKFQTQTADT